VNRHERRKAAAVKRLDQRANLRRALRDPLSKSIVIAEYSRRHAMGLPDANADMFPASARIIDDTVLPQAPDAAE
jgi:hypothetical protein